MSNTEFKEALDKTEKFVLFVSLPMFAASIFMLAYAVFAL